MTIRLATGINPPYVPRAQRFLDTAALSGVDVTIFGVNFPLDTKTIGGHRAVPLDYSKGRVELPKKMLQMGNHTDYAPPDWQPLDTIIFTDADSYFQRPFTEAELAHFRSVSLGEVVIGYNMANQRQTLLDEATKIFPRKSMREIQQIFPGIEAMECRNFGFVVADLATWKELYRHTMALWPQVDACFANPARVQWCAMYAIQARGMKLLDLSPAIHAHGHCGIKHGLTRDSDGVWRQDGEVVAFAHAL